MCGYSDVFPIVFTLFFSVNPIHTKAVISLSVEVKNVSLCWSGSL